MSGRLIPHAFVIVALIILGALPAMPENAYALGGCQTVHDAAAATTQLTTDPLIVAATSASPAIISIREVLAALATMILAIERAWREVQLRRQEALRAPTTKPAKKGLS